MNGGTRLRLESIVYSGHHRLTFESRVERMHRRLTPESQQKTRLGQWKSGECLCDSSMARIERIQWTIEIDFFLDHASRNFQKKLADTRKDAKFARFKFA
eukprot:scaffold13337_cov33-Cyclotella_meneghiniana.AAC.1